MDEFEQALVQAIGNSHPETLAKAVELARLNSHIPSADKIIADTILRLESQGKIAFKKPVAVVPYSFRSFLLSGWALWFWTVLASALATAVMVFLIPEGAFPLVYIRYVFGTVFVLFLPGYSLIRALFIRKEIDDIERLALSIGLSLALVPLIGLLLNYTPWGIRTTPVTLSLLTLTLIFAVVAVARDFGSRRVTI